MRFPIAIAILSFSAIIHAEEIAQSQDNSDSSAATAATQTEDQGKPAPLTLYAYDDLGKDSPQAMAALQAQFYDQLNKARALSSSTQEKIASKTGWFALAKTADQGPDDVANLIVNKYHGCEALDDDCKNLILTHNRTLDKASLDAMLAKGQGGDVMIPVQGWQAEVQLNVGDQFRSTDKRKNANGDYETKIYVSKNLAHILNLDQGAWARWDAPKRHIRVAPSCHVRNGSRPLLQSGCHRRKLIA